MEGAGKEEEEEVEGGGQMARVEFPAAPEA